MNNSNLLLLTN